MPFIYCPLNKIETPQLLRDYRSALITIASLEYDLRLAIYLGHPGSFREVICSEIEEYFEYSNKISEELKKRGI
jgi:hypothetical protein